MKIELVWSTTGERVSFGQKQKANNRSTFVFRKIENRDHTIIYKGNKTRSVKEVKKQRVRKQASSESTSGSFAKLEKKNSKREKERERKRRFGKHQIWLSFDLEILFNSKIQTAIMNKKVKRAIYSQTMIIQ